MLRPELAKEIDRGKALDQFNDFERAAKDGDKDHVNRRMAVAASAREAS